MVRNFSDNNEVAQEQDVLGGKSLLPTGIYEGKLKMIFWDTYASGTEYIQTSFEFEGKEFSQRFNVLNKKGDDYYLDKENQKQRLPDGQKIHSMIQIASEGNLTLSTAETATKIAKVWNKEAGGAIDTEVEAIPDLIDIPVCVCIQHIKENKTQKNDAGEYVNYLDDNGEVAFWEKNEITKFLCPETKRTLSEILAEKEEATFSTEWLSKYENEIIDKVKPVSNTTATKTNTFKKASTTTKSSVFKK